MILSLSDCAVVITFNYPLRKQDNTPQEQLNLSDEDATYTVWCVSYICEFMWVGVYGYRAGWVVEEIRWRNWSSQHQYLSVFDSNRIVSLSYGSRIPVLSWCDNWVTCDKKIAQLTSSRYFSVVVSCISIYTYNHTLIHLYIYW